jgi:hypothetical protein
MYRGDSHGVVGEEISKYKLDLVGLQEVKCLGGGIKLAGDYTFFYGKRNENHELGTAFFVHKRTISAIKRVEFVTDSMSYMTLRSRWCNIVPSVHALTEKQIEDIKDRFYEELEQVFDKLPKYHMKLL